MRLSAPALHPWASRAGRGAALVGRYLSARLRSDSARLEEGAAPVCVGRGGECRGRPGALLSVPKPAAAGGCRRRLRHRQPRRPCGWREERGCEGSLCGHSRTLGHAACLRSSHSPPAQPQVCAGAVWEAGRQAGRPAPLGPRCRLQSGVPAGCEESAAEGPARTERRKAALGKKNPVYGCLKAAIETKR